MNRLKALILLAAPAFVACAPSDTATEDAQALQALHTQILDAHLARDADAWTALEADTVLVGNRGRVFTSTRAERLAMRRQYFAARRFSVYRDLQPPVIQVARDGSQGWVVASVEVISHAAAAGESDSSHTIWAWIELYEKRAGRWIMVGNLSNERPGSPTRPFPQ